MSANEVFALKVEDRVEEGSAACRRLRRAGKTPVVVYHDGKSAVSALVDTNEFVTLARKATSSHVFKIISDNSALNGKLFLVKDIQKHSLNGEVLHADFYTLVGGEPVSVTVPIHVLGAAECKGVKAEGGVLKYGIRDIKVKCLPSKIPEFVSVDITELRIGHNVCAKDVALEDGVELASEPNDHVVAVVSGKE